LEKLWATYADGDRYFAPAISRLDKGDFLIADRMMAKDSIVHKSNANFDFNQDEKLDYIVIWNRNGKFDYDQQSAGSGS
jgi:hypothetical protein